MTYSDFSLPLAVNKFGLTLDTTRDLFAPVEEHSRSDHLRETLAYNAPPVPFFTRNAASD